MLVLGPSRAPTSAAPSPAASAARSWRSSASISGVAQANLSCSVHAGTLRGLHYQLGDEAETKLVTCLRGALHDVVLDLRPASPTYGRHAAVELTQGNWTWRSEASW